MKVYVVKRKNNGYCILRLAEEPFIFIHAKKILIDTKQPLADESIINVSRIDVFDDLVILWTEVEE
jgi:hypothetical protein